jgi:hypothetical protein
MLVVATAPVEDAVLRDRVREHAGPDAEVRVVAPASDLAATPADREKGLGRGGVGMLRRGRYPTCRG